jgi:hypothetical protein
MVDSLGVGLRLMRTCGAVGNSRQGALTEREAKEPVVADSGYWRQSWTRVDVVR